MPDFSPLRWGIIGCGSIARRYSNDVVRLPDHRVQAIASRDAARAADFAQTYPVPTQYAGKEAYAALVADPEVDVVYVATPHNYHKEHTLLALEAGKPVLCEKPFTVTLAEAEELFQAAKQRNLFLMEAMWSVLFPALRKARELVGDGAIGEVRMVYADFGFQAGSLGDDHLLAGYDPKGRLFNKGLAGGCLLDVGVYPLSFAQMILGEPEEAKAIGVMGHSQVDENVGMVLRSPNGAIALASTSLQVNTPAETRIIGTQGRIEVASPWWRAKSVTLHRTGSEPETFHYDREGEGFQYEAMHVAECLRAGKTESDILSHNWSRSMMRTLDRLRAEIGYVL